MSPKNLLILHANGYFPESYRILSTPFQRHYQIIELIHYPIKKNGKVRTYSYFADQLIEKIEQDKLAPVYAIGHSFGALLLLMASVRRPELFHKLALIEPVLLPSFFYSLLAPTPLWLRLKMTPPARIAVRRKENWKNLDECYAYFRSKNYFKGISDPHLKVLVESIMVKRGQGWTLRYHREQEALCYANIINPWPLLQAIKTPYIGFQGQHSEIIRPRILKKWCRLSGKSPVESIPHSGHLLPFEKPELVTEKIQKFFS